MAKITGKGIVNRKNNQITVSLSRKQLRVSNPKLKISESKLKPGVRFSVEFKSIKIEGGKK